MIGAQYSNYQKNYGGSMISNPALGQYVTVWYRQSNRDLPYHGKMGWVEVAGKGRPRNHLIIMVDNFDSVIVPCGNLQDATKMKH